MFIDNSSSECNYQLEPTATSVSLAMLRFMDFTNHRSGTKIVAGFKMGPENRRGMIGDLAIKYGFNIF